MINKLIEVGKYKNLVQTTNGDFVTSAQIQKEIKQILSERQSIKISTDLTNLIGVPHALVMKQLQAVKQEGELHIHILAAKDLAFTHEYVVNTILKQVKDDLEKAGMVSLTDLAQRLELTLQFIVDQVTLDQELLASGTPCCKLEKDVLISLKKEQDREVEFKQVLAEIKTPLQLDKIYQQCGASSQIEKEKIQSLIKVSNLGRLHQNTLYIPHTFIESESKSIAREFESAGFLDLSRFQALFLGGSINEQVTKILGHIPDVMILDHFIFSKAVQDKLRAKLEQLNSEEVATCFLVMDDVFEEVSLPVGASSEKYAADLALLLNKISAGEFVFLQDYDYVCSRAFVEKILLEFKK